MYWRRTLTTWRCRALCGRASRSWGRTSACALLSRVVFLARPGVRRRTVSVSLRTGLALCGKAGRECEAHGRFSTKRCGLLARLLVDIPRCSVNPHADLAVPLDVEVDVHRSRASRSTVRLCATLPAATSVGGAVTLKAAQMQMVDRRLL